MSNSSVIAKACPNPNCMVFNTRMQLAESQIEMGPDLGSVGQEIQKMRGVTDVFVGRYHVQVEKGECFTWDEVAPQISEFLGGMDLLE